MIVYVYSNVAANYLKDWQMTLISVPSNSELRLEKQQICSKSVQAKIATCKCLWGKKRLGRISFGNQDIQKLCIWKNLECEVHVPCKKHVQKGPEKTLNFHLRLILRFSANLATCWKSTPKQSNSTKIRKWGEVCMGKVVLLLVLKFCFSFSSWLQGNLCQNTSRTQSKKKRLQWIHSLQKIVWKSY